MQVFEGRSFNDIRPLDMMAGVTARLDALRPDAVAIHSYGYPDARAILMWCRRHQVPAILMNDSRAEDAPRVQFWRERLKRRIVAQYDAALISGTAARRYLHTLGYPDDAISDGYDVVDNAYFRQTAQAARQQPRPSLPGLSDPTPYLLASSRFITRKALDVLLLGYARYRRRAAHPARLVLLGDGPERPALEALVAQRRISEVTFAGFRQIEDIPAYYAFASAFVHTARIDQWGLVVNEAMAAGLPVVVSQGTGCHEDLVRPGANGFTFKAHSPEAFADALIRLEQADLAAFGAHSEAIIAQWDLDRFTSGMETALAVARTRCHRDLDPVVAASFRVLGRLSRRVDAFHTVEA